jgi:hypothetical protein
MWQSKVVAAMRKVTIYAALTGAAALAAVQALCQVPGGQGGDFSQAEKQFEQRWRVATARVEKGGIGLPL